MATRLAASDAWDACCSNFSPDSVAQTWVGRFGVKFAVKCWIQCCSTGVGNFALKGETGTSMGNGDML